VILDLLKVALDLGPREGQSPLVLVAVDVRLLATKTFSHITARLTSTDWVTANVIAIIAQATKTKTKHIQVDGAAQRENTSTDCCRPIAPLRTFCTIQSLKLTQYRECRLPLTVKSALT
jgi:hypothetical protein